MKVFIIGCAILLGGCAHVSIPMKGGECPHEFPIKGNADSFIYHTPASLFYMQTRAEVCFATEESAARHGYRQSRY